MSRANLDDDLSIDTVVNDNLEDSLEVLLLQCVDDETIGSEQAQNGTILYRLQRPDPGVELLLRNLCLQVANAAVPKRHLGRQRSPQKLLIV